MQSGNENKQELLELAEEMTSQIGGFASYLESDIVCEKFTESIERLKRENQYKSETELWIDLGKLCFCISHFWHTDCTHWGKFFEENFSRWKNSLFFTVLLEFMGILEYIRNTTGYISSSLCRLYEYPEIRPIPFDKIKANALADAGAVEYIRIFVGKYRELEDYILTEHIIPKVYELGNKAKYLYEIMEIETVPFLKEKNNNFQNELEQIISKANTTSSCHISERLTVKILKILSVSSYTTKGLASKLKYDMNSGTLRSALSAYCKIGVLEKLNNEYFLRNEYINKLSNCLIDS